MQVFVLFFCAANQDIYIYIYPVVKLLLSFTKIINLIQYLLGGTVFYYSTALGTYKCTSTVCHLEVLGRALTGSVV